MEVFKAFLEFLSPSQFHLTVLDYVILAVILFYALEGYLIGLIAGMFDLVSFVLSFLLALRFYSNVGDILLGTLTLPRGISDAVGFFLIAFFCEIIFGVLFRILFKKTTARLLESAKGLNPKSSFLTTIRKLNHYLGILPGVASAYIILSFLFSLVIALPFFPFLTQAVSTSQLAHAMVSKTQGFEKNLHTVFGGALNETINFLTVTPESDELVNLNFKITSVTVDTISEQEMLQLVNKERAKVGLVALLFDESLAEVARMHSKDMFARGYFSHYTPSGVSPFDRMGVARIRYVHAGENLAYAPTTELAMQGLMESKGHWENILSEKFGRLGIGVIDGGAYGKMFSQEFTD